MNESVLVIDDSELNLEIFSYLLGAFGYRVRTATSGRKRLEIAHKAVPDLIFCDILMPGMNGYQVVNEVRADPILAAVPVVAVTALAMIDDRNKIMQSGFDGYISKPIDPRTFVGEISTFFSERARTAKC